MRPANYDTPRATHKQSRARTWRDQCVTIPNAYAVKETVKALICDLGDGLAHPIAKSQIAPKSEIQRLGDRGILIITRYLADEAGLMPFARAQSRWALVPHAWQVMKELNVKLPQDDPARAIIKIVADALRKDLGIESSPR